VDTAIRRHNQRRAAEFLGAMPAGLRPLFCCSSDAFARCVYTFQLHSKVPPTGRICDATIDAVREVLRKDKPCPNRDEPMPVKPAKPAKPKKKKPKVKKKR